LYKVAVAEILLQKTRAGSAVAVYRAIVARYPTAFDLIEALEIVSQGVVYEAAGRIE